MDTNTGTVFDSVNPAPAQPQSQPVVSPANAPAPASTGTVFDSVQPSQPSQKPSAVEGTISSYTPTVWERVENMFREPARARRGDAAFRDNPEAGNRIFAPEALMTESEKANHPIATGLGEFTGQLTSAENVLQLVATSGLGAAMPFLKGAAGTVIPRLISAGFSGQMLYNAYRQYPAVKAAFDKGDVAETERLLTHLVLGVGMAALAGQHAAKGETVSTGKPTMYEAAQARRMRAESEEFFPTQESPNPMAPKPAKRNLLRPTTVNTAGVEAPISAAQQENPSLLTKAAGHLASPGAAREFQQTQTVPAASRQLVSTLGQRIEDLNNAHNAIIAGEPAPEPVAGTQQPSKYETIDDAVQGAKATVKQTWDRADAIDKREQDAADAQRQAAIAEHKRLLAEHNTNVFEHNQNLAKGEAAMEPIPFDESQVNLPERPRTLAELRSAEQQARSNAQSADAQIRQQAYEKDIPKAEKDLDNWFRQHEDEISPEEWQSAKNVYRTASRMQDIANSLRAPMLRASETGSGLTGNTLRAIEARINTQGVKRGQGADAFKQLLGPEAYDNWKSVARVLDPVKGPSQMERGAEYFISGALGFLHPILTGAGIGGKALTEFVMNRVLFHPEWGKWFTKAYENFKQTGNVAPEAQEKLQDLMKYTRMTNQELKDAGFTQQQIDAGVHLPGVGGGSQAADVIRPTGGQSASESADEYNFTRGRGPIEKVEPMAHPQGKEIADAFDEMKHDPSDPAVQKAYGAMKNEIDAQWDHAIQSGFKFEPWDSEGQPYKNSKEMKQDIDDNHHLYFFRGVDMAPDHPMAEIDPKTGLTYNEKFRAVHDLYGHATGGYEFGPKGEEAAYKTHAQMFSPEAIPALTSETRGQNNWVNFGKHLRDENGNIPGKGEPGYLSPVNRPYAENKAGLLPSKFYAGTSVLEPKETSVSDALVDKFGTTNDPSKAGFILNDGRMVPLRGIHDAMLAEAGYDSDRADFVNDENAIRTRFRMSRRGKETVFSLPDEISPKQLEQIKSAVSQQGQYGNFVMENARQGGGSHAQEMAIPEDVQPTLDKLGVKVAPQTAGTEAGAKADTDFMAQAKAKLPNGTLSEQLQEAQRLKDAAAYGEPKLFGKVKLGYQGKAQEERPLTPEVPKPTVPPIVEEHNRVFGQKNEPQDLGAKEITTRRPTSVSGDLSNNPGQHANLDAVNQAGAARPSKNGTMGYKEKLARTVADYAGVRYTPEDLKNPDKVIGKFINHIAGNLEWLHGQIPEEIRAKTQQWYDSAHSVLNEFAKQYGMTHEQAAGVTAALSPQNPWDNNVGLAKRMMDIYTTRQNFDFTPEMERKVADLKKVPTQSKAFKALLRDVSGKKLNELNDPDPDVRAAEQALWIRLYDEAHNSSVNDQYAPTGEVTGHSPDNRSWIGLDHMAKAVRIMENGSVDNINNVMGFGHKIRNFYNNLINPNSNNGHVTIDTHAVAAAHLQPFGAKDVEAMHNFGNTTPGVPGAPKDAATGLKGTYPLYAEAYQRVAKKLGIQPRQLQSITWEGIKSLMGDEKKTPELKARTKEIWQQVQEGKLTLKKARDIIKSEAGGFSKPTWMSDEEWEKLGPEEGDTSFGGFNE